MPEKMLKAFEDLFSGVKYKHRNATLGDYVALHVYEDLYDLARSPKFVANVNSKRGVFNKLNQATGIRSRRGDSTFGEAVPGETPLLVPGFNVARGIIATIEIGIEVKILQKAMIKQIDRVIGDLQKQVPHFKSGGDNTISLGIVGINQAPYCISYEGEKEYRTTGNGKYRHPIQEAEEAERRINLGVRNHYDELLILRYRAINDPPYEFQWVNYTETVREYGAALVRISREFERRF